MSLTPEAKPRKTSGSPTASARAPRSAAPEGQRPPAKDWRVRPLPEPVDWDEALRLYAAGKTYRQIAEALGQNYERIRKGFNELGAERPRRWQCTKLPHGRRLRDLWSFLRLRCTDPKHRDYPKYGGQGIRFGWDDFDEFYDWAMAKGYAPGLRLDRKDLAGDFVPRNCKWVAAGQISARNPHPARLMIKALGEVKGASEWVRDPRCRVSLSSLQERLERGWPPEEAVTAPRGARPSRRVRPPAPRRRSTPARIDWDEVRKLYAAGASESDLMARYGATRAGIVQGMQRRGIERRPRTGAYDSERKRLADAWARMHRSCEDPTYALYPARGGRGLKVCRAWRELEPFLAWARASGAHSGLWLARKDPGRGFTPANCTWEPPSKAKSVRGPSQRPPHAVRLITAFGETKGLEAWSRDPRAEVNASTISKRLARGMTTEEAIATPRAHPGPVSGDFTQIEAFGTSKSKSDWLRDPRCKVGSRAGLTLRLARGWPAEQAIATPPFAPPPSGRARAAKRSQAAADSRKTPERKSRT